MPKLFLFEGISIPCCKENLLLVLPQARRRSAAQECNRPSESELAWSLLVRSRMTMREAGKGLSLLGGQNAFHPPDLKGIHQFMFMRTALLPSCSLVCVFCPHWRRLLCAHRFGSKQHKGLMGTSAHCVTAFWGCCLGLRNSSWPLAHRRAAAGKASA